MSRGATGWPLGESIRVPAHAVPARRRRGLSRLTWALVAAAFLCGALASAAGLSIGWRHQAERSTSAQAALATMTARNHRLSATLARVETQLARARREREAAAAAARRVARESAALAAGLVSTGHSAEAVSAGAAFVGGGVDKLAGELKTLASYLVSTPTAQLDAGYVATQTAYLSKQLEQLRAARGDLAAAVANFERGAKTLATHAGTLAGRD